MGLDEDTAVSVEGLGKRYWMETPYARTVFRSFLAEIRGVHPRVPFWALRDVSFRVGRGERFGVIGPNGAGKSTLLRVLAGILSPEEGRLDIQGSVRSPFLGISSGLHAELSVEDNVRLCGALLGLSGRQAGERLEKILDFAELGEYRYVRLMELSSGMAGRLSFSTAVHADLDILLADEMLAAGDAAFQAKCKQVFERLCAGGRTVILSSHSMEAVQNVCGRCLYLDRGRVKALGPTPDVVRAYEEDFKKGGADVFAGH